MSSSYVLGAESVADNFRTWIPLVFSIVWFGGYVTVGILRYFVLNWRWLYFFLASPGVVSISFYWWGLSERRAVQAASRVAALVHHASKGR